MIKLYKNFTGLMFFPAILCVDTFPKLLTTCKFGPQIISVSLNLYFLRCDILFPSILTIPKTFSPCERISFILISFIFLVFPFCNFINVFSTNPPSKNE